MRKNALLQECGYITKPINMEALDLVSRIGVVVKNGKKAFEFTKKYRPALGIEAVLEEKPHDEKFYDFYCTDLFFCFTSPCGK